MRHLQPPRGCWLCLHVLGSPQVPVPQPWEVPQQRLLPHTGAVGGTGVPISAPRPREPPSVPGMVPTFALCLLGSSALLLGTAPGAQGKADQQLCSSGAFLPRPSSSSSPLLSSLIPVLFPVGETGALCWSQVDLGITEPPSSSAEDRDPLGQHQSHTSVAWEWHPQPSLGTPTQLPGTAVCSWQHRSLHRCWVGPGLPCQCFPGSGRALRMGFRACRTARKSS